MRSVGLLLLMSGCQFVFDVTPETPADGSTNADSDTTVCVGSFAEVCLAMPPTEDFTVSESFIVDTDDSCLDLVAGPVDVCVIAFASFTVAPGTVYRAIGSRPHVVISSSSITVGGTIDMSSTIATNGDQNVGAGSGRGCPSLNPPLLTGGAAGGSFGSIGGSGGEGSGGGLPGSPFNEEPEIDRLGGGCAGGDATVAAGGRGGGGLLLIAPSIIVTGTINASGAGGAGGDTIGTSGGGGGGSGGMIVLDGTSVTMTGLLFAHGGGGGGGATMTAGQPGGNPDPQQVEKPATGGIAPDGAGSGGIGATGATATSGQPASGISAGGGGGGGGTGVIRVVSPSATVTGTTSPAPR